MANQIIALIILICISGTIYGQKRTKWGLDVFPLDVKGQVLFNLNSGFKFGVEAEVGVNFSNYILLGGSHFSSKYTLIRYQKRDQYDNERYYGALGIGVFTRINEEGKIPLDIGLRTETFIHYDDSDDDAGTGFFYGGYLHIYKPIMYKDVDGARIEKISLGLRMSVGLFKEYNLNELGILTDAWVRFHL